MLYSSRDLIKKATAVVLPSGRFAEGSDLQIQVLIIYHHGQWDRVT